MILMQQSLIDEEKYAELSKVKFLVGCIVNEEKSIDLSALLDTKALQPFDERIVDFLNLVSKKLRENREAKAYPDIVTLAFFMRKASIMQLRDRFVGRDSVSCINLDRACEKVLVEDAKQEDINKLILGRGIAFHIAPSNVPVNFAYSLVTGLVTGNVNIVRVPSKEFPQVNIIVKAINDALDENPFMKPYIYLVKYERNQLVNDIFSALCDTRIIWGGDSTIAEIRKSPLPPRSTEVTFADRYSLAIIDSDEYMSLEDKDRFAEGFYNDTYLSDQNACTSPRVIAWIGNCREEAKEIFWEKLHKLVDSKYTFQPIMGVNKLTNSYILLAKCMDEKSDYNPKILPSEDNLIMRIAVDKVDSKLMDYKDNSGYFFEVDIEDVIELKELCNDNHCQTVGFLGKRESIIPLLTSGIKGVDRVVPIGKTMDFDFIWDGYNLFERLTRIVAIGV